MTRFTGERYLPSMEFGEIHFEHLHRYAVASELVRGKRVLDLACGEGYGSNLLANSAKSVVGVDIDGEAISEAVSRYKRRNLRFVVGSIEQVPVPARGRFDIVICFEAIEHIDHPENMLKEAVRLLTPRGVLIVSTPNKKVYTDETGFKNPYHRREYYLRDLSSILKKHFTHVEILGQRMFSGSEIWTLRGPGSGGKSVNYFLEQNEGACLISQKAFGRKAKYFVALASIRPLKSSLTASRLRDSENELLSASGLQRDGLAREIDRLRSLIEEKDNEIPRLAEDRDHWRHEYDAMKVDRDTWQHYCEEITADRDRWQQSSSEFRDDRDSWMSQYKLLEKDRDEWQRNSSLMEKDRDRWQTEYRALEIDRDRWKESSDSLVSKLAEVEIELGRMRVELESWKGQFRDLRDEFDRWKNVPDKQDEAKKPGGLRRFL